MEELQIMKDSWERKDVITLVKKRVKVIKSVVIPVNLGGRKVGLTTEVMEGDIPWLLGKKTLKQMKATLDLGRGLLRIVDLGHVKIVLRETEEKKCLVKSQGLDQQSKGWKWGADTGG